MGLGGGHDPKTAAVEFGTVRVTGGFDSVNFGSMEKKRFASWPSPFSVVALLRLVVLGTMQRGEVGHHFVACHRAVQ